MTNINQKVPDDIWKAFKICCAVQGIKAKEGIIEAISQYIENIQPEQVQINFQVVADKEKNLLTFIYEGEMRELVTEIVKAQKRKAPGDYMEKLKDRLQTLVKKHPKVPEKLADEILAVFKIL